jgi:negative regulator of flagellin synthesis FlgM
LKIIYIYDVFRHRGTAMKIDGNHNPKGNPPRVTRDAATASGKPCPDRCTPVAATADRVHLSPRASALAEARRQLDALPDIDMEKVREIQHRLQSGRYRLDADKIAERMIREALDDND